jgi:hypothetical protein
MTVIEIARDERDGPVPPQRRPWARVALVVAAVLVAAIAWSHQTPPLALTADGGYAQVPGIAPNSFAVRFDVLVHGAAPRSPVAVRFDGWAGDARLTLLAGTLVHDVYTLPGPVPTELAVRGSGAFTVVLRFLIDCATPVGGPAPGYVRLAVTTGHAAARPVRVTLPHVGDVPADRHAADAVCRP